MWGPRPRLCTATRSRALYREKKKFAILRAYRLPWRDAAPLVRHRSMHLVYLLPRQVVNHLRRNKRWGALALIG
jgi:hypothetical protein